jgi:hypothetical protein
MFYLRKFKVGAIALIAMSMTSVTACSSDDDPEEVIYHQSYIQGTLNDQNIAINDINANILIDKSNYEFCSGNQTDIPAWFDWEVKLVETENSIITLYLHIDNVNLTDKVIYSPNDEDPIKTTSTCYATVEDLKNDTTYIYHPTHPAPMDVMWDMFMMTVDKEYKNLTKDYDYTSDFIGHRWPGMEGRLDGTLSCDDKTKSPLKIDIKFAVY